MSNSTSSHDASFPNLTCLENGTDKQYMLIASNNQLQIILISFFHFYLFLTNYSKLLLCVYAEFLVQ